MRTAAGNGVVWWVPLGAVLGCAAGAVAGTDPAGTEFFEKKVRPVLVARCHTCHSTGQKHRGNLLLDSRAGVLRGGDNGPAVVPEHPERSLLVKAIGYQDDLRMPPRGKLSADQVRDLTAWVRMGAPWPAEAGQSNGATGGAFDFEQRRRHWAFQPLRRRGPPQVRHRDWPRSPPDRFVLAQLEARGLAPAPPADRRTLLRRVTYDLTGLPPTPGEVADFLRDTTPGAYERVVERLLASPHYGERWGRHWLDLVRFAETSGHEYDFEIPEAFAYRDYVIRAFNADLPYDRFVIEQVAGDLLPKPRRHPTAGFNESVLGTGFWYLGESKHSPVDLRGDGADRRDNQIDVFAKTFLGLTVACARCHDHKFDPISTRDYYALVGCLQSSRFQRAFLDDPARIGALVRRLHELQAQARTLAVARSCEVLEERLDKLGPAVLEGSGELFRAWRALADRNRVQTSGQFTARRCALLALLRAQTLRAAEAEKHYTPFDDFKGSGYRDWYVTGHAFGTGPSRVSDVVLEPGRAVPVKALVGSGVAHSGLVSGRLQGALRSRTFTITGKHILYQASGRGVRINLIINGFQQIRDPIYGGLTFVVNSGQRRQWYVQHVGAWVGQRAYIEVLDDGPGHIALDRVLFSDRGTPPEDRPNQLLEQLLDDPALTTPEALAWNYRKLLQECVRAWRDGTLEALPDAQDRVGLLNLLLSSDLAAAAPGPSGEQDQLQELVRQWRQIEAGIPEPLRAPAMADGTGVNERVYIRGNPHALGAEAPRRILRVLGGDRQPAPVMGSGRLELARRLVDASDPLLPRVLVNRLWQHHFGAGLVRSPDNFGIQGERPTHPELLDWLADEFVRQGWSVKRMQRLMVLSSAYRMASRGDPEAERADPRNQLLHRMPIRRLEAEAIRDAMLAVSGQLDRGMYGPGPLPYLTPFLTGRGRPAVSGPLDGAGRRSIYLNVRRNFLNPMFLAFDYPIPCTTMGRRSVSNVPAQALTLLNNPFVVQQARRWSEQVLAGPARTARERVTGMYVAAFGREPSAAELGEALAFLEEQRKEYGRADDPRAWADLCHVLFNVKEFIFVN